MAAAGRERLDPRVWKIAAVASLGPLLTQMDATIVNVSLSSLSAELHAGLSTIQWVTSGYLLALAFTIPLNAWLVERIGTRALCLWCLATFTASSVLCGLAWSAGSLIGFRLLQGASGGLLAPMAQLLIRREAGPQFTRVAGYAALPVLLGPVLGPVIAGAILHVGSWRWLFLVTLPIGSLSVLLAWRILPDDRERGTTRRLDWLGLVLLSPGLALLLSGLDHAGRPAGIGALAAGAMCLLAFVGVERRRGDRALIDLGLFRGRTFLAASMVQFLWNGVLFAGQMLVPVFLIRGCGRSPQDMGWMLAPLGVGLMVTVPSLGVLSRRFGERRLAISGAGCSFLSTLALAWLAWRGLNEAVLAGALFVRGMAMGAVGLPVVSLAYASIGKEGLPMAATTLNIVQRIGGPILTTLCALFLSAALAAHGWGSRPGAWVEAFLLLSVLHAALAVATASLPRRA